jgi:hypothetical protein
MTTIPFTGNYQDLSTDRGYQFKFYCEKCNNGYMSSFKASAMGMIGSAARVADSSYEVQRAVGGTAHDSALKDAEAAREQIQQKAREVDWTKSRDVGKVSGAVCGQCGAKTQGGKFCQECGAVLAATRKCGQCGHEAEGSPKFCPECGQKY